MINYTDAVRIYLGSELIKKIRINNIYQINNQEICITVLDRNQILRCFALEDRVVTQLYKIRVKVINSVTVYQKLHFFYLAHNELTIIDAAHKISTRVRSSGLGVV